MEVAVDVTKESAMNVELVQTGYVVSIESPIESPIAISQNGKAVEMTIAQGVSRFCVREKVYHVQARGCFETEEPSYLLSPEMTSIQLVPSLYSVEGVVEAPATANVLYRVLNHLIDCRDRDARE